MSKAKYKKGEQITDISEFAACDGEWYKWRDKTVHRAFLISLQYRVLDNAIKGGIIFRAERAGEKI